MLIVLLTTMDEEIKFRYQWRKYLVLFLEWKGANRITISLG